MLKDDRCIFTISRIMLDKVVFIKSKNAAFSEINLFKRFPGKMVSYNEDSELLLGEIVNVVADDSVLDENDKVDVKKLNPICYDTSNHGYFAIGERIGSAFSDGKEISK